MRILLVDDDETTLRLQVECLGLLQPGWVIRSATSGQAALDLLAREPIDLLVTDIQMPSMDGLALLDIIRRDARLQGLPLIFATGRDDRASVRNGMASGADDYLTKPYTAEELAEAIQARMRRAESGRGQADDTGSATLRSLLTERELDVLRLVGQGLVTKEIAAHLGLSPATVSVHRANIMRKLDLHTANALAACATRARL